MSAAAIPSQVPVMIIALEKPPKMRGKQGAAAAAGPVLRRNSTVSYVSKRVHGGSLEGGICSSQSKIHQNFPPSTRLTNIRI
jgi:hypothetical protein